MVYRITIKQLGKTVAACPGENLLSVLQKNGAAPDAPCGGQGTCGKCKVFIDGKEVSACKVQIHRDMTVSLPERRADILTQGTSVAGKLSCLQEGHLLAFDIGTTTLAGVLSDGTTGAQLAVTGRINPQVGYGADVISRIRHSLSGRLQELTQAVQAAISSMTLELCSQAGIQPELIGTVSIVGNPTMQQLYLGMDVQNLAQPPFAPVLTKARVTDAADYLPVCKNAKLLIVPNISGFVGADTVACVLSSSMAQQEEMTLLVDIGTNGEIVLGNRDRMVCCATAAGPALEGANIRFGSSGKQGAIDHVWLEQGKLTCSVIGNGKAQSICGSGLIDALAVALEQNLLDQRGKILTADGLIHLCDGIYLTQEDIRQVQLAKGAIAAGIALLFAQLGITEKDVDRVLLAGAFGTYMDPASACRIGLLPATLLGKIRALGNGALSGAVLLCRDKAILQEAQALASRMEFVELASLKAFPRCFARHMRF